MPTTTTHVDTNASRARWGALLLGLGLVLSLVSFSLILALGAPPADMAAKAARVVNNAGTFQLSGYLGMFGNALLALGAMFLATRPIASRRDFPASAFWLFFAFGGALFCVLDAFKAAALVPLAVNYAGTAAVYQAADAMRGALIGLGTIVMGFGATMVFWAEFQADRSAVPKALSATAAVAGALVILGAAGTLAGIPDLSIAGLAAYVMFVALLFLAARVAWPPPDVPTQPATRIVRA